MAEFKKLLKDSVPETEQIAAQMAKKVEEMRGKLNEKGQLIASEEEVQRILQFLQDAQDELSDVATFIAVKCKQLLLVHHKHLHLTLCNHMDGENALDSFKNFAKNIVNQIYNISYKWQLLMKY